MGSHRVQQLGSDCVIRILNNTWLWLAIHSTIPKVFQSRNDGDVILKLCKYTRRSNEIAEVHNPLKMIASYKTVNTVQWVIGLRQAGLWDSIPVIILLVRFGQQVIKSNGNDFCKRDFGPQNPGLLCTQTPRRAKVDWAFWEGSDLKLETCLGFFLPVAFPFYRM